MTAPIHTILFASDLSAGSAEVLGAAAQVAALTGAALHVVHALEPSTVPHQVSGETVIDMQKRIHEARYSLMKQLKDAGATANVASARIVFGAAPRAIQARAREVGAELTVIGSNRGRTVGDRFLGTTADRLVRTSDVPCLIVREPLSLPLRRMLVPTDFSKHSAHALNEALTWAAALGRTPADGGGEPTEIVVMHVIPQIREHLLVASGREWVDGQLREQIEAARGGEGRRAALRVRAEVVQNPSPAVEILREADETGADLLVLGTHGRGFLGRALIGSVSSVVARHATCAVLLIPPGLEATIPGEVTAGEGQEPIDVLSTPALSSPA